MKLAIFGKGKTGSQVIALGKESGHDVTVIDSSNFLAFCQNKSAHQSFNAGIVFTPPDAFIQNFTKFSELSFPLIIGTTGIEWTADQKRALLDQKRYWIHGRNFSIGMTLVRQILPFVGQFMTKFPACNVSIHEIHHTKKLDGPSGTAKAWAEWVHAPSSQPINITFERIGDEIGFHKLTIETPLETITLAHQSRDRKLFAAGALWCAEYITNLKTKPLGLTPFEQLAKEYYERETTPGHP